MENTRESFSNKTLKFKEGPKTFLEGMKRFFRTAVKNILLGTAVGAGIGVLFAPFTSVASITYGALVGFTTGKILTVIEEVADRKIDERFQYS